MTQRGLLLATLTIICAAGCGGSKPAPPASTADARPRDASSAAVLDPKEIPVPAEPTGTVNVYTSEPGFAVFVDGEIARDQRFEPLLTPCQVTVARGRRLFTLAKKGFADITREMLVEEDEDMIVPTEGASGGETDDSILKAALLLAPLAEPIPLVAVNSSSSEQDPFITGDGLTLYFASDRPAGRGVYVSTRRSPYDQFGPPQFIASTRSPDTIASPSVTANGLTLVYCMPEKARVSSATRPSVDAVFGNPEPVQFSAAGGYWPSSQILGNGLQVFWTQGKDEAAPLSTMSARRKKLDQPFTATAETRVPGGHPALSDDGLRQYVFDGKVLRRARRATVEQPFSELEVIAKVELPNYTASKSRRQFCVSSDEQWLFYSDLPEQGGDLYTIRLLNGRGWGPPLRGKAIPPLVVASRPEENADPDSPAAAQPAAPKVDPRTLPLPYAQARAEFVQRMASRKYEEAVQLVQESLKKPEHAADVTFLKWDLQDAERVQGFWQDVRDALGKLKPGAMVRIGSAKVELVKFENDTIHAKAKTKEVERTIDSLAPVDLAALIEDSLGKENAAAQLRMGVFLHYDPQGNPKSSQSRVERGGEDGRMFLERIPERSLHLAEQEIARDNAGAALLLLESVLTNHPESASVEKVRTLIESIYRSVEWTPIAGRKWQSEEAGEYVADATKSPGSALRSPREFENFELRLEWKVTGALGQGGVFFHWNGEDTPSTSNAFKLHLANDSGQASDMFATGALFKVESPTENASLAEGMWNTLILRVRGDKVQATINGKKVLDTTVSSKEIGKSGWVCLDGAIGGIAYRKTLLIELPPAPAAPKPVKTPDAQ